jgi:predicted RNase H-like HicB family nuclease
MPRKVSVVIEHDENGYYAYCPELPGCHSQGPTLETAIERIKEAIDLYLETLSPEEIESCLSREILTTSIEVRVA